MFIISKMFVDMSGFKLIVAFFENCKLDVARLDATRPSIAVKLELSARHINNKLYAFNLLSNTNKLVKEAIIKFAISATDSKMDAARFLGIDYEGLHRLVREYNLQEYFDEINN